jgi:hypothetical protein
MKDGNCKKLDTCSKIERVMDQDLAGDWQYAECIKETCKRCDDKE